MRLVAARKVWNKAPHNAFTDLIYFRDQWFCVFREGQTHVSPDGIVRVIASSDGKNWNSSSLIEEPDSDLRDPKLSITPDGQLMLSAAVVGFAPEPKLQSSAWFSSDGATWDKKLDIGDHDFWLWRISWHERLAYSVGYKYGDRSERLVRLYRGDEKGHFEPLVGRLFDEGFPNETSIVFSGDTAFCLLRRDGKPNTGLLGVSEPPYTEWDWRDLGVRIGGPHMLILPDGRLVAAVRLYDETIRTSLCTIDPEPARLTEVLRLPSGGDTSYAGLAWHEGKLWIAYYSSHEGNAAIYVAEVEIEALSCGKALQQTERPSRPQSAG